MLLSSIYEDSHFSDSVVKEGYVLLFFGYSNGVVGGDIVQRYKDSSGNFGTIAGGSSTNITEQLLGITESVETVQEQVTASLTVATTISNQLDDIIGE